MADERLRALERAALAGDRDAFVQLVCREQLESDDPWAVTLRPKSQADRRVGFRHVGSCMPEWLLMESPWKKSAVALVPLSQGAWPLEGREGEDCSLTFQDRGELCEFLSSEVLTWTRFGTVMERIREGVVQAREENQQKERDHEAALFERQELCQQRDALRSIQGKLERARATRKRVAGRRLAAQNALRRFDEQQEGRPTSPSAFVHRRKLEEGLADADGGMVEAAERLLRLSEELRTLMP